MCFFAYSTSLANDDDVDRMRSAITKQSTGNILVRERKPRVSHGYNSPKGRNVKRDVVLRKTNYSYTGFVVLHGLRTVTAYLRTNETADETRVKKEGMKREK